MNKIEAFITGSTGWALASVAICGAATIEMAISTIEDMGDRDALSKNLAGALFYGLCAANIVPYTAVAGAVIFAIHSCATCDNKDAYLTAQAIGVPIKAIWNQAIASILETKRVIGVLMKAIWNRAIVPVLKHVVEPAARYTWENTIEPLAKTISKIFAAIFAVIELPSNPAWYGVATLVAAIVAYQGLPMLYPLATL